jgi:hypothetical protein
MKQQPFEATEMPVEMTMQLSFKGLTNYAYTVCI